MSVPTMLDYHELTDRVTVIEGMLHDIVSSHRVAKYSPPIMRACKEAEDALERLVQVATQIESKHHD